jgi:hypothetical protein
MCVRYNRRRLIARCAIRWVSDLHHVGVFLLFFLFFTLCIVIEELVARLINIPRRH